MTEVRYRYTLEREVGTSEARLCWVMLNPSTADDELDDPTIRRVKRFTYEADYGRLVVVNLFAARSTRPIHLPKMADPVGPLNEEAIRHALLTSHGVVFAWGASAEKVGRPRPAVESFVRRSGRVPLCLGTTKTGAPRHPLYVPAYQPLVPFGVPA